MRRRFGRGHRGKGAGEAKAAPIDAAKAFEKLAAAGIVTADSFEAAGAGEIAEGFVAVGTAERDGQKAVIGFAPRNAGDVALATIAVAQRLAADEGFAGEAVAVAPQWSASARRRLAAIDTASLPFRFRALAETSLDDGDGSISADSGRPVSVMRVSQIAAGLPRAVDRELFLRAAASLEGLAAKHGGAVRGVDSSLELVLVARRVAAVHAAEEGVRLEILEDERSNQALTVADLATAMDRLEGLLRKRLNDRRVKGGEEGLRAQLASALSEMAGVRHARLWPIGGSETEVVDVVGVHDDGRPIVGAIREKLTLQALGEIVDAATLLQPALPVLLADAGPPLRFGSPRLLLAAKEFDAAVVRVLPLLGLEHVAFDIELRRGRSPVLVLREGVAALRPAVESAEKGDEPATEAGRPRSRGRRGGRRSRGTSGAEGADAGTEPETLAEPEAAAGGKATDAPEARFSSFDEVSLFDLAEEQDDANGEGDGGEERSSRRGRGRGRGRRRRGGRSAEAGADAGEETSAAKATDESGEATEAPEGGDRSSSRSRGRRRGRRAAPAEDADSDDADGDDLDDDDLSESLAPLDEVPGIGEISQPEYDDEEEEDEGEDDLSRRRREAELRARAAGFEEPSPEPEEKLKMPRKRAAIVVHADRGSLLCGILLARDLRQIEGLWVYGQEDLMTFFRGVTTDLPEDTPIYVIGFTASPARDAVSTAALYRGRLAWFDHHDWPPEDLGAMREAIGDENLHVTQGAENSLSEILSVRLRRSRFSDKVVELATGQFSQHDYERWGRLWWHRLSEIAKRTGDRRADVDGLLSGRPSDLAKEAAQVPVPPVPAEVGYVSERDFRLVHFHGFTLVVVPTPPELDLHLTARIARERFDAQVSVARIEGEDLVVLGADEGRGRRGLDLSSMVTHLATKHEWVSPLPGEDYVARLRILGAAEHPERFDELLSEIAMGRSILEG